MEVKHEDKDEQTNYLQMACNMVGLGVNYIQIDLILRLQKEIKEKKGKFSISDGVDINEKWKEDWDNYFEKQEQKNDLSPN